MGWLDIVAPFAGQLLQERGDSIAKSRDRTLGLAEDRYKRQMDVGQQVGTMTLRQMMEDESPLNQARVREAQLSGDKTAIDLATKNALSPEQRAQLEMLPVTNAENEAKRTAAYARQVDLQAQQQNKTPSQKLLETEDAWVALMVQTRNDPAQNDALYNKALAAGLDDQPKSPSFSPRFASWVKNVYKKKGDKAGVTAVDQVGAPSENGAAGLPADVRGFLTPTMVGGQIDQTGTPLENDPVASTYFTSPGGGGGDTGQGAATGNKFGISPDKYALVQQAVTQYGISEDEAYMRLKAKNERKSWSVR